MKTCLIIPTVTTKKNLINNFFNSLIETTINNEYTLIIVRNDYQGFAKAVNQGFKSALGDPEVENIILLNDDVEFFPFWLENFINGLKTYDAVGAEGSFREQSGERPPHIVFWAVGFKRSALEKIGLLDEQFIYGECEDLDWCARAQEAGLKLGKCDATINHYSGITLRRDNNELRQKERIKNHQRFLDKWRNTKWVKLQL